MSNPFNPLDWLKSAQDWFSKTEKSSGFRPFLIFMILVFGVSIVLMILFRDMKMIPEFVMGLLGFSVVSFIALYWIKAFTDGDFCRSESHVERMAKIEAETMGSESRQVSATVIEREMLEEAETEPKQLADIRGNAMNYYVVVSDRNPSVDYSEFHRRIAANPAIAYWWHYIKSMYVIGTEMTARDLSEFYRATALECGVRPQHLVLKVDLKSRAGWLPEKAWAWLRDHAAKQQ